MAKTMSCALRLPALSQTTLQGSRSHELAKSLRQSPANLSSVCEKDQNSSQWMVSAGSTVQTHDESRSSIQNPKSAIQNPLDAALVELEHRRADHDLHAVLEVDFFDFLAVHEGPAGGAKIAEDQ